MTLSALHIASAALAVFIAWGFLTSWSPVLRYLGYAFTTGFLVALLAVLAIALVSVQSKKGAYTSQDPTSRVPAIPAFLAESAWRSEIANLDERALYTPEAIYPPSFVISHAIDGLLEALLHRNVTSWYRQISARPIFVNEIDRSIRIAIIELRDRILDQDVVELVVSRIIPIITKHLQDFYEAERAVRGINLNRHVTESADLDLAIAAKYNDGRLHPAASLSYADLKIVQQDYLRKIMVRVLPDVLPESVLGSRSVSILIREIMSCAILAPLVQRLSDPDTWNQLMATYARTMVQDRKTVRKLRAALDEHASPAPKQQRPHVFPKLSAGDDERKFERFIRSIRQCTNLSEARRFRSEVASQLKRESIDRQDQIYLRRLGTGKKLLDQRVAKLSAVGNTATKNHNSRTDVISNSQIETTTSKPTTATLREVLYDATGLSYFMEFMDRRRRMTLVQFWIVVDGFRNPLEDDHDADEDPFGAPPTRWTDSDRLDLAQISDAYLSKPELQIPEDAKDAVKAFLRTGTEATMAQYVRARTAVLKAQSLIFLEMEESHFPDFKRSDLFYKYLTSDEGGAKVSIKAPLRAVKPPTVATIPESPSRPPPLSRLLSGPDFSGSGLRRSASSNGDLKISAIPATDGNSEGRRSLDIKTSGPLFDDDLDNDPMAQSTHSLDNESMQDDTNENQEQMVNAVEAALNGIMIDDGTNDENQDSIFDREPPKLHTRLVDSPRNSGEFARTANIPLPEKPKERPNLASLGLVNTSSRIGVFSDDDLFGDEEKFLEDEHVDGEATADEKPIAEEIHEAAPGDLGLAEAITALTADIDRLAAQDSVVDTLTRKAELTNNIAELRILTKSKSSLQREIRRKELQRQQYIVQESDNSLYGRASAHIKSVMVGREGDGQEFALYVIEVQRKAGEHLSSAASWAVARRYSEFHDLHQRLRSIYPAVRSLDFPRRRLVMKLQRDFLHRRRLALEEYLAKLLQLPAVCRGRDLRAFLSQSAIVSTADSTKEGERRDIISRIYNSVTDGMDDFLGNVPVLDQLSVAGQNLISAAATQFNTMTPGSGNLTNPSDGASASLPIAPEDPIQTPEARAELLAFDPNAAGSDGSGTGASTTARAEQFEPFVKPICDLFLETFDLQRGNNWLRGRAVVVVLHQLLGGTVERKVRENTAALFEEAAVVRYIDLLKTALLPDEADRMTTILRTETEKAASETEARVMLATLMPDLAGNVVGRANAQAAARRLHATFGNGRLNAHLIFVILDEVVNVLFPT